MMQAEALKVSAMIRADAKCPRCGTPLLGIVDEIQTHALERWYFHEHDPERDRRRRPCVFSFEDRKAAAAERAELETRPRATRCYPMLGKRPAKRTRAR